MSSMFLCSALLAALALTTVNSAQGAPTPGVCYQQWRKVYENNPDGTPAFGMKEDLQAPVVRGARVRFFVGAWGNGGYSAEVDNLSVREGHVCAQALMHVSHSGYNRFQDNSYWWFLYICTTGNVHMARYNVGAATSRGETKSRVKISWFIKDIQCESDNRPVLSHLTDGSVVSGSKADLVSAVFNGNDVRAVTRDSGYAFPLHNLQVSPDHTSVGGQSIWHVSAANVGDHVEFQSNAYWWFTMWSTSGFRDMSRWTIGVHQDRGHSNDKVALDWFSDPCWRHVYTNNENGGAVNGSLSSLVSAVEQGHRIRAVMGDGYSIEVDNAQIKGGHVSAVLLNHVSKASYSTFQDNAYWYWEVINTSGKFTTIRYNIGSSQPRGTSNGRRKISWFVDTRPWNKILATNLQGQVTYGSKSAVRDSILQGRSFRLSLQFSSYANNQKIFIHADNLELGPNGESSAQSIKHISLVPDGNEFKFNSNPYWWFIIVSTQSDVDASRWKVGEHVDKGHDLQKASVEWFVNY